VLVDVDPQATDVRPATISRGATCFIDGCT
jgi:hypothetical protein